MIVVAEFESHSQLTFYISSTSTSLLRKGLFFSYALLPFLLRISVDGDKDGIKIWLEKALDACPD